MNVQEVNGHPALEAVTRERKQVRVTVCAECESLSSILFLTKDRWLCTRCRAEGDARPVSVPVRKPTRR